MSQSVVTSLAILNVNYNSDKDYIDLFVPFVAESLRSAPQDIVSASEVQKSVKSQFGLHIPQNALKTILRRAQRQGYVTIQHNTYQRNVKALGNIHLTRDASDVARQYEELINKLITFCKERFDLDWSNDIAESYFLAYLEEHSIPVLVAAVEGLPIEQPPQTTCQSHYPIYAFVQHLSEADPNGFDFLTNIVKGRMLSDVLLFPDFGSVKQQFNSVEFYLDTPFLLRALGYNGEGIQAPCLEMIEILRQLNGRLFVFGHTLNELHRVLDACEHHIRLNGRQPKGAFDVLEYFLAKGYKPGDIAQLKATLELSLRNLNIRVKDTPVYTTSLGIDEAKLQDILQKEVGYKRDEARDADIASLTAIHRLRGGQSYTRIENCKAIFVTTNTPLARAMVRFLKEEYKEEYLDAAVPYCMLDHVLSTLVWLKSASPPSDLPQKRIIANCYAALNPPDALWGDYLNKINDLLARKEISSEEYDLLRYDPAARNTLMDITLGGERAFTEGTVQEVLEHAKAVVRQETEQKLKEEQQARLQAETAHESEATARIRTEQTLYERERELGVAQKQLQHLDARASEAETRIEKQRQTARQRGERAGAIVRKSLLWGLGLLVFAGLFAKLPVFSDYLKPLLHSRLGWIVYTVIVVAWSLDVLDKIVKLPFRSLSEMAMTATSKRVEGYWLRQFQLPPTEKQSVPSDQSQNSVVQTPPSNPPNLLPIGQQEGIPQIVTFSISEDRQDTGSQGQRD